MDSPMLRTSLEEELVFVQKNLKSQQESYLRLPNPVSNPLNHGLTIDIHQHHSRDADRSYTKTASLLWLSINILELIMLLLRPTKGREVMSAEAPRSMLKKNTFPLALALHQKVMYRTKVASLQRWAAEKTALKHLLRALRNQL
jgi:hypothetical protein